MTKDQLNKLFPAKDRPCPDCLRKTLEAKFPGNTFNDNVYREFVAGAVERGDIPAQRFAQMILVALAASSPLQILALTCGEYVAGQASRPTVNVAPSLN